jgi:hypothetical protein
MEESTAKELRLPASPCALPSVQSNLSHMPTTIVLHVYSHSYITHQLQNFPILHFEFQSFRAFDVCVCHYHRFLSLEVGDYVVHFGSPRDSKSTDHPVEHRQLLIAGSTSYT